MDTSVITKMKIRKPGRDVFEALTDPVKIGNFWFTSRSKRWQEGEKITLRYEEYNAEGTIHINELVDNRKIVFTWGAEHGAETIVTISLEETDGAATIIAVAEEGLDENDPELVQKMTGQKEGWVYMLCCLKAFLEHGVTDLRASLIH